ncbi:hypothetical protein [Bacillus sp. 1NLA3E]|uniref:hypothetical protein n=1 Tax=Bacillus sp. 1NLA3E TaxID=666686 RepID=UPI000247EE69|nr:hypothetical protein [Bacillus sp. 1NLA3E]AGK53560.1 hypothetical protein B1NLA3E_08990 [Bacillus sp. 1NLA3E]
MKRKIRNSIVAIILFISTIAIVLGAGIYKNTVSAERAQFQAEIPKKSNPPIVLDLDQQSLPKKLVQPGLVQIYTGHGPMGVTNRSNEELLVQVSLRGFPGKVELVMPEVDYDEKTFALTNALKPGKLFKMELAVEVPKEYRNKLVGFSGEIQFINQKDKSLLSSIPVHIVNSKYGDPYKKLNIKPSIGNGSWGGKPGGNGKPNGSEKPEGNEKNNGSDKEKCH